MAPLRFPRLVRSGGTPSPLAVATISVTPLMLGIGFIPLFGGPGYEHSLASGLVVPGAAAIAAALELSARPRAPVEAVGRGVLVGLWLALAALATAFVHGLRVGICDLWGGVLGFVLTAGFGSALGGAWGACVAELARGRKRRALRAILLAVAAPLGCIAVSVGRFYASPIIFAFDPFVGHFSGTLYDTVVDAGTPLVTYRAGSLATLAGLALVASSWERAEGGGLRLASKSWASRARLALGMAAWTASLLVTIFGYKLGHWQTAGTIAEDLGGFRSGARCDVVYPAGTREDDAALLVRDCEEELASVETTLGTRGPDRVTAFFFRDAGDKRRLMGAAETNIAKPWRHEVYVTMASYPHSVLGHEIAHVVAGSFARGPFHVAGKLGGLWPNPGLIEGVAVAASPDDDELDDAEWAHALDRLHALPPARTIFSFDFLGAPAAKAYTVAGAFVSWVLDRWGAPVVRAWYGGGSLEELTHESWAQLDEAFRAEVAKTELSPEAEAYAKARFEHAAIFGRKCPHVVDALRGQADHCRDTQQTARAVALYGDVLARDPHDWAARYGRGLANVRYGDVAQDRKQLGELAEGNDVPRTWRDRAEDALGDADLLAGNFEEAVARYRKLAERSLDEDFARTTEVKALASHNDRGRPAVEALLLGGPGRPADLVLAAERLGEWGQATGDVLAFYLIGKNLVNRGWYGEGARYLDLAIDAGPPPTARIGRELLRQRAIAACALHDRTAADHVLDLVEDPRSPYGAAGGRRAWIEILLDRCAR